MAQNAQTQKGNVTIQDVISYCKRNFDQIWQQEAYKWDAVQNFKSIWQENVSVDDFPKMLSDALDYDYTRNLLTDANYYARAMICQFAEEYPARVHGMFQDLFQEGTSLADRLNKFIEESNNCREAYREKDKGWDPSRTKSHYQDARSISVYLSFMYPDQFFLYKYRMYTAFRDLVGFQESIEKNEKRTQVWKYSTYLKLCDEVLTGIKNDPELCGMLKEKAAGKWKDINEEASLHLFAQTVIYVGSYTSADLILEKQPVPGPDGRGGTEEESDATDVYPNTILYGPPGTGKTYHTAHYAVAIVEGASLEEINKQTPESVFERFHRYRQEGRIEFVTFHQSYGYEDFVEGIRPVLTAEDGESSNLQYELSSGIFQSICEKASQSSSIAQFEIRPEPAIWKVSLNGTGDNEIRRECMKNEHIRIGWDEYGEDITDKTVFSLGGKAILNAFLNKMQIGDIVLSCYSATTIDAIGVVTGDYEWNPHYPQYRRLRDVRWLVKGIQEDITSLNNGAAMTLSTIYRLNISVSDIMSLIQKYAPSTKQTNEPKKNYVLIIDEINRGNISKIFGELITLIEPSKRLGQMEEQQVRLPASKKRFGVPDNLFILGTMNTADRSIALMDTALRRRFRFVEMLPDYKYLDQISEIEGINIAEMLQRMNERIEVIYDREHVIGHAYFQPLREKPEEPLSVLGDIFRNQIIPLLQEYFYNDYERIRLVLADQTKKVPFIRRIEWDHSLFPKSDFNQSEAPRYEINHEAFGTPASYLGIYCDEKDIHNPGV